MDAKTRFMSVFSEEREKLDRVPTFVQSVLGGFISRHEEALFDDWEGELTFNADFDAAMILGFDAKFSGMPCAVGCDTIRVQDKEGNEHMVGLSGQVARTNSTFYSGGVMNTMENLEKLQEAIKFMDVTRAIKDMVRFHDSISKMIFPVPMIGGIFDSVWQAMGFSSFAREFRKNSKLYRGLVELYAKATKANIKNIIDAAGDKPAILAILDDVAFKGRPMIPPDRWRQDIGKHYKEITSMIHDAGMHAITHTDGDITELIPAFIDAGFEGVQGWEGGADPQHVADHHPDFVVIGFGDVGHVLPFGTEEQIREHVKHLMGALKDNRHYVFGPSTVVFKEMPIENVLAFTRFGKELGTYT